MPRVKLSPKTRLLTTRANNKRYRNSEQGKETDKLYRLKHKAYYKKLYKINNWKQLGIVDGDLKAVYDTYIKEKNCWICDKEFLSNRHRHLDHDHFTGEIRYICCPKCNAMLADKYQ